MTFNKKYSKKSTKTIRKSNKFDAYHRLNETMHHNKLVQNQKKMEQPTTSNDFQGSQLTEISQTSQTSVVSKIWWLRNGQMYKYLII